MKSYINRALHSVTNRINFLEDNFKGNNNYSPADLTKEEKRFRSILELNDKTTDIAVLAFVVALENNPDLKKVFEPENQTYDIRKIINLQGTTNSNFYFNGSVIYFNNLKIYYNGTVQTTTQSYDFKTRTEELLNDRDFINFAVETDSDIFSRSLSARESGNYIEVMACLCTILGKSNLY